MGVVEVRGPKAEIITTGVLWAFAFVIVSLSTKTISLLLSSTIANLWEWVIVCIC